MTKTTTWPSAGTVRSATWAARSATTYYRIPKTKEALERKRRLQEALLEEAQKIKQRMEEDFEQGEVLSQEEENTLTLAAPLLCEAVLSPCRSPVQKG